MRALLLVGGAEFHNRPIHYAELAGIFAGEAGVDLRITSDLDTLEVRSLARYDAIINWSTGLRARSRQIAALIDAVEHGVGFLGLHAATATFLNSGRYLTFLGAAFIKHPPIYTFRVDVAEAGHPITRGVESFAVEDERYEIGGSDGELRSMARLIDGGASERDGRAICVSPFSADADVLARAEDFPILYARTARHGRLHYNALGHDERSLRNPSVRQLCRQGLAWVAGS